MLEQQGSILVMPRSHVHAMSEASETQRAIGKMREGTDSIWSGTAERRPCLCSIPNISYDVVAVVQRQCLNERPSGAGRGPWSKLDLESAPLANLLSFQTHLSHADVSSPQVFVAKGLWIL